MKMNWIYGLCIVQLIGVGVQFMNRVAGNIMITSCSIGILLYTARQGIGRYRSKICPKCNAQLPKRNRICPNCGHRYAFPDREEELTDLIEQRRDEEDERTSELIDCDFEKIEEVAIDTITSFDGNIQEFLEERERLEEIVTVK